MRYDTNKFIKNEFNHIFIDTPVSKAYDLGVAVGMLNVYRHLCDITNKELADKIFSYLDTDEKTSSLLGAMIELDNRRDKKFDKWRDTLDIDDLTADNSMSEEECKLLEELVFKCKKGDKKNENSK